MAKKFKSESEKWMYEYIVDKYFKKLHLYIEVNIDSLNPRRTEIKTLKVFRDEKKCIKFGKSRKKYIREYNDENERYSFHQFYEDAEYNNVHDFFSIDEYYEEIELVD